MKRKLLIALTAVVLFLMPIVNLGQAPDLGSASSFALFTAAGAFSNDGATVITGDIGTNVGAFTGFPPGIVIGQIHVADAVSAQAAMDVDLAYGGMSTITCGSVISTTMGGGAILLPNVYCLGAASTINGDLILDGLGDTNALFIFKIDGALATTVNSRILFTNSASLCNVWWQVNGQVDLGENSLFQGTILANGAINLLEGATLNGRGLTRAGAIASHNTVVTNILEPTPSIITANGATTFCEGESVVLSGNVDGTWNTGESTGSITVSTGGDYFVTNANACGSAISNLITVTVTPQPIAPILLAEGPTTFCEPGSVVLSGNNGGVWSTGETTPTITVTAAGEYFVTMTNECGSAVSNLIVVTVEPMPVASIISADGPTSFCEPGSVVLSGNNGGTWSTGETTESITVMAAGDYFVTNTTICGSVTSNHILVTINPLPVPPIISAEGPTTFCEPGSVVLSGNAGGVWSTGETTPTITVSAAGEYFITMTNECGSAVSNLIVVMVDELPVASIISADGPTSFCEPGSVTLSGNIGGTWNTGETTETITVTTAGDYFVTNTTICGSVTSNHIQVTINPLPVPPVISAEGPTTFCEPGSVVLSGNNGGVWSTGETTPTITVSAAGEYFITMTNECGSAVSNLIVVMVDELPVASIISANGPTSFCEPGSVTLSGNIGGTWSTGETTETITVTTAGDYFVTNTTICGSVTSNHIQVTINPLPVPPIILAEGPTTFCEPGSVVLSGNIGGVWSTGETTPTITVTVPGEYFVTITNECGNAVSNVIVVLVDEMPIASIISANGPTSFCEPGSVTLSGNIGGTWSTGETTETITVTTAGDYFVSNTTICGSVTSNHIQVTINPLPVPPIILAEGPTTFCEPGSVVLSGNTGGVWSTGETTPTITVTVPGEYFVTITNECGSAVSNLIVVMVEELPIASIISANGSTILCVPESVILSGNIGGTWSTGESTETITVTTAGDYFVTNTTICGSVTSNHIIVESGLLPGDAGTIIGSDTICQTLSIQYCVPFIDGATSYIWTYSGTGAIIIYGLKCVDCIWIDFPVGSTSGILTVQGQNDCGVGLISEDFPITVEQLPVELPITANGPTTFCEGGNVELIGNNNGIWSTGETTPSLTVTTSGLYYVIYTNTCGVVNSNFIKVTVEPGLLPGPGGTILGLNNVCQTETVPYCVPEIENASSYVWNYSGSGVTIIELKSMACIYLEFANNATSGNLTVQGFNVCGDGIVSPEYPIIVEQIPEAAGSISGSEMVYQGQNALIYSVPMIANATSYIWNYSGSGVTINGTENTVTLDFASNATSGDLTVKGSNFCGEWIPSPNFPITVNKMPAAIVIKGLTEVIPGQGNVHYKVSKMANAATYFWSYSGNGATINGNTSTVTVDFNAIATSGILSVKGFGFGGTEVGIAKLNIFVKPTGIGIFEDKSAILNSVNDFEIANTVNVFPNPARDVITISSVDNFKNLELVNFMGETIFKESVSGNSFQVDVSTYGTGMYFIKIQTQRGLIIKRVTIR